MKRFLTTAAMTLALAAPAFAMDSSIRAAVDQEIDALVVDVDVASLTDEQVRALYAALSSDMSAAEKTNVVESIVTDSQFVMSEETMPGAVYGGSNELRATVERLLDNQSVDADVGTLSDAQVSALYLELTSGESANQETLEAIIMG